MIPRINPVAGPMDNMIPNRRPLLHRSLNCRAWSSALAYSIQEALPVWTIYASSRGWKPLRILYVVIASALTACFPNAPSQPPSITLSTTNTLSASVSTRIPVTAVPTHRQALVPTLKPQATNILTSSMSSIVPPARVVVEALQIELDGFEHSLSKRCVLKALWSDDERLLYYASSRDCAPTPIQWAAYDVASRITQTVTAPPNYDGHIWARLNLNYAPELFGYRSPSGKYIIYPVERPPGVGTPAMEGKIDTWIADSGGHLKIKLLTPGLSSVHSAAWLKGETKVILDLSYEGAARDLRLADVDTGKVVPLQDVTDFKAAALDYALSPDGITLAIVDLDGNLWLVSTEDGRARIIDQVAIDLSWLKDGSQLYYRWGTALETASAIHSYNIRTGDTSTVVDEASLAQVNERLLHGEFAVSLSGDKIAIWNQQLWLLQLNN